MKNLSVGEFRYFSSHDCMFLQEILSNSLTSNTNNDEHSTGKSRGWLNWLSRGMLGAGGTDDLGQFSGVVSDEVIQVSLIQLGSSRLHFC